MYLHICIFDGHIKDKYKKLTKPTYCKVRVCLLIFNYFVHNNKTLLCQTPLSVVSDFI